MSEACMLVAEVSVEGIRVGALRSCWLTGHPVACAVATGLNDAATGGVAKYGVEKGCSWSVEVMGPVCRATVKAGNERLDEMRRTYEALNTVEGIRWIMNSLNQ